MIKKIIVCLTLLVSLSSVAQKPADRTGFIYGLGLSTSKEIYKGYNRRNIILPIIGYRGEKLNVYGPFVSYNVAKVADLDVLVQVAPRFQGFDEDDSYIFAGMADRKISMDAGIGLKYQKNNWKIGLSSMFDVLNRSNGVELTSTIAHTFRFGPVFVEPSVVFSYLDSKHVDYYYGVGQGEVNANRVEYIGQSGMNSGLGLSISTPILLGGFTQFSLQHTWFASEITDSPLVEKHSNLSIRLLYSRKF
ncbi:MipA/OmpV family protein [Colwellia sp. 20A7]|uniref:MipA/OmpV family protein n=1 Tax=Colwellia sp. 20A7 TaxID=2689569 RepID=UPI001F1B85BB|nr:MipA/OmpV family protein [Colwellia sp. 20A7]